MKKNRIALAIILIILVMTLVACGDTVDAPDKDEYVVTIHPNNGDDAFEWKVTDPIPNLTYEGYVLEGFYVDSDFTSSISLSTLKITGLNGNIDVYVKWKKEECEHDVVIDDAVPATCTESGLTEGKHCSKCDEVLLAQTEVPALGHTAADAVKENEIAPTCTTAGSYDSVVYCSVCDAEISRETKTADALDHNIVNHNAQAPTCTEVGWEAYETCSRCDYSTYVEIPATGHNHVPAVTAPTCTEKGYTTYTCACGDSYIANEVPATGHTPEKAVQENIVPATCLKAGSYDSVVYCDTCGKELSRDAKTINALGHDTENHNAQAPTCTEAGWKAYVTCSRCDYTTYAEIPATGHTPAKAVQENVVAATCLKAGGYDSVVYCDTCGKELSRDAKTINALGHDTENHNAQAPTCTEAGWKAYETCSRCDYTTYVEIPATGHDYKEVGITEPTCTGKGYTTYTCHCGDTYKADEVAALEHTYLDDGSCSICGYQEYVFSLNEDGESYTITGLGEDFEGTELVIPAEYKGKPVTSIGSYAFEGCISLTSVEIHASVEEIGKYAFSECINLSSVTFEDTNDWYLKTRRLSLEDAAQNATYLTKDYSSFALIKPNQDGFLVYDTVLIEYFGDDTIITIPDGVTSTSGGIFTNCTSLTSVIIPDSLTLIGSYEFGGCTSLTSVIFGENSQLKTIGDAAFLGCGFTSINIPASVEFIALGAFGSCSNLTSVTFEENSQLTTISNSVFQVCTSLTSIAIPDSVTTIGSEAFQYCSGLTSVTFGENSQLTTIGVFAFRDCTSLTSIVIPDSVTTIGKSAFYECTSLTDVYYLGSIDQWDAISFENDTANPLYYGANLYIDGQLVEDNPYSKTIIFYSTQGGYLQTITQKAIEAFEAKYPGWTVVHYAPGGYDQVKDKIISDFQGGVQPDLAYCYPDHVAQYLQTGKVVDMTKFIYSTEMLGGNFIGYSADEIADFIPGYYNEGYAVNFGGYANYGFTSTSMLTLPFVKSTELLYYNKSALDALGLPVATTWDQLWAQCEAIVNRYPTATPLGHDSEASWFITMCQQNGWGYTTANGSNNYLFNNANTQAWLTELQGYYDMGYLTTQEDYGGYTSGLFTKGVDKGGLVYCIASSAGASHQDPAGAFEWGVAPIPGSVQADGTIDYSAISQGPSLVMFSAGYDVRNVDEKQLMTWLFIKELLDPTFQADFSLSSGYNPCRQSTFEVDEYIEHMDSDNINAAAARVVSTMSDRFYTSPAFKGSSTAREQVGNALVYTIQGQKSAGEALYDAYTICSGDYSTTVHTFIDNYMFPQAGTKVVANFNLSRSCEYNGQTATITWSVDTEYADYIEISADGNTCIVYPSGLDPQVKIKGTFSYGGRTATKTYTMVVSEQKEHLQAVDYWYANTGVGMEMKGYVVEIATVYSPSYGNISLYIVDEDFCAGYYLYRVKCDAATAERLVPGAPVIVYGTTNTNYNGLIETNAGGTIVIDNEREALTEIPVHALDNEAIGGLFSANYHQSTLVSLTNWKVKEVKGTPAEGSTSTLFIITKGGVEVLVAVSRYMEGAYFTKADDAVWSALAAHGIQVGDVVTVTGILGNYKGHQIMPLSIDGIVKGGTADADGTVYPGQTAAEAVAAIDNALVDNGLNMMVAIEKSVAIPTVDGATIAAKVLGVSRAVTVVDGAIVIAPNRIEKACVQFDITVGEFKTSIFRYIQSDGAHNHTYSDDGSCSVCGYQEYTFELNEDGESYTITGLGKDFEGTELVIPAEYNGKPVISVSSNAFSSRSSLTSIVIPDSVTTIGNYAFRSCTSLTSITIPTGVTSIGEWAFYGCGNLTDAYYPGDIAGWCGITLNYMATPMIYAKNLYVDGKLLEGELIIPDTITEIKDYTFLGCTSLTNIIIPDSVTCIGHFAFFSCTGLTRITISDNVTTIGKEAFAWCSNLTSITIPGSLINIKNLAFDECSNLTDVYYTGDIAGWCGISFVGTNANPMRYADNLYIDGRLVEGELVIPDGVASIPEYAFIGQAITEITIPDSVTTIGENAFYNCTSLTSVTFGENSQLTTIGDYAFEYCSNLTSIVILDGVTTIGYDVFYGCTSLTNITIPDSVSRIGDCAFSGCTGLTSISVDENNPNYKSIDGNLYSKDGKTLIQYAAGKTDIHFEIPDSVTTICFLAFYNCSSLTSVTFGENSQLTTIGSYAFAYCTSLTSIVIPDSVTTIGSYAFRNCDGLTDVYYTGTEEQWNSITIDTGNDPLTNATIHYNYVAEELQKYTFELNEDGKGYTITGLGEDFVGTELIIPAEYNGKPVTSIGDSAFSECSSLTSIVIPDSVTTIGYAAFYECTGLTSIVIPDSVTTIGDYAFETCTGLTSVTFGENSQLTTIDSSAFRDCTSLTSITIPASVTTIGYDVFYGCNIVEATMPTIAIECIPQDKLKTVVLTSGTSIEADAFNGCTNLTSITIPDSVTTIGDYAFHECDSLTNVYYTGDIAAWCGIAFEEYFANPMWYASNLYVNGELVEGELVIPNGVTTIPTAAFYGCSSLTSIVIPDSVTSIGNYAFYCCTGLTSVTFGENSQLTSIGDNAFQVCGNLTSIIIPDSVTSIGIGAFGVCSSLTNVTIGSGVTSIGGNAFIGCSGLTDITIPDGVTNIGDGALSGCSSLESITIPFVGNRAGVTSDDTYQYPFGYIFGTSSYTGGTAVKQNYYFSPETSYTQATYYIPSTLRSVTVTGGNILFFAFGNCSMLTSITLGDGVPGISDYAFRECNSLISVTIPASVTSIGENAFTDCIGLTSVTFEENSQLTSIGDYAFRECSSLTSIVIPDSATSIGYYAFGYCTSLTTVTFGKNSKLNSIDDCAFSGCTGLTSITLPDSLTSISYSVFSGCSSLTSIVIPDSVTTIDSSAFYNCNSLTDVYYTGTEEQWNSISIQKNNEALTNATIHYNYVKE